MNKNPFINAGLTFLYIVFIVSVMFRINPDSRGETIFVPIIMLSLFVFSAAVMGYLFVYEPLQLHLDNKRQEAISFFFKTLGTFAGLVLTFLLYLVFSGRF
ncbi:MAG: hypothetical protein WBL19_01300 [Minisyncoccia bacterium]